MKKLEAQIAGAEDPGVKAVGILLSEICRISPQAAELVEQDLENKDMSVRKCYAALRAYAKAHQSGGCWACPVIGVDPENEAVKVILDFYGVPAELLATPEHTESQAVRHASESLDLGVLL